MPIYFLVFDADLFHRQIVPPLAQSWRERSFAPCRALCETLKPAALAFAQRFHTGREEPMLALVSQVLPFDRAVWRLLAGEVLLFGACEVPEIMTAPETLACLLAHDDYLRPSLPRSRYPPVYQAHYGTRDLVFGSAFYRPDDAGLNDVDDVARLAGYLETVEPERWTVADLSDLRGVANDEDRLEELELVRDWFPLLTQLYVRARQEKQLIVCEMLGGDG